jgi:hypothetical protein
MRRAVTLPTVESERRRTGRALAAVFHALEAKPEQKAEVPAAAVEIARLDAAELARIPMGQPSHAVAAAPPKQVAPVQAAAAPPAPTKSTGVPLDEAFAALQHRIATEAPMLSDDTLEVLRTYAEDLSAITEVAARGAYRERLARERTT